MNQDEPEHVVLGSYIIQKPLSTELIRNSSQYLSIPRMLMALPIVAIPADQGLLMLPCLRELGNISTKYSLSVRISRACDNLFFAEVLYMEIFQLAETLYRPYVS